MISKPTRMRIAAPAIERQTRRPPRQAPSRKTLQIAPLNEIPVRSLSISVHL